MYYEGTELSELQSIARSMLSSLQYNSNLTITMNGNNFRVSDLVTVLETIDERLRRIEQTGIIERLRKAEVMK